LQKKYQNRFSGSTGQMGQVAPNQQAIIHFSMERGIRIIAVPGEGDCFSLLFSPNGSYSLEDTCFAVGDATWFYVPLCRFTKHVLF
jgi:hypothetical protein